MRLPLSAPTQTALVSLILLCVTFHLACAEESTKYKICKNERKDCRTLNYRVGDVSKGLLCREECGQQRGDLTETFTVYHCEGRQKSCTPYQIFGRMSFDVSFERHAMCVKMCHFVAKAQHNTTGPLRLCSGKKEDCAEIPRVSGTFDAFNWCAFQCDGWTLLENTKKHITYICNENNDCQQGAYFTEPKEKKTLDILKTCFKNCMPNDETTPMYTSPYEPMTEIEEEFTEE
ncbi:hypothetical protein SprV_0301099400 [Sparganum proliferum]